jgi:hypothetical protein
MFMHHCHFILLQHNYTKKRTVTREHLMSSSFFFLQCSYAKRMTTREHSCVVVIFLFVLLQHNYAKRRTTTWQHFHIIVIFFLLQCSYVKRMTMTHEHSHVIIIFLFFCCNTSTQREGWWCVLVSSSIFYVKKMTTWECSHIIIVLFLL